MKTFALDWKFIFEHFPIGRDIEYLGLRMVVSNHIEQSLGMGDGRAIVCEYADGNGIIREHVFGTQKIRALLLKNEIDPSLDQRKESDDRKT